MPDNVEEESLLRLKEITEDNLNHTVRCDPDIEGIVNIEVRSDGRFNVKLHKGTTDEVRTIESVPKDKLLKMMEEQL